MSKNSNAKNITALTKGYVSSENGVFKITKDIAGHKANETISEDRALELAKFIELAPKHELYRELIRVPSHSYIPSECEHGNHPAACNIGDCYFDDYDD
jgi:hypothetical protein